MVYHQRNLALCQCAAEDFVARIALAVGNVALYVRTRAFVVYAGDIHMLSAAAVGRLYFDQKRSHTGNNDHCTVRHGLTYTLHANIDMDSALFHRICNGSMANQHSIYHICSHSGNDIFCISSRWISSGHGRASVNRHVDACGIRYSHFWDFPFRRAIYQDTKITFTRSTNARSVRNLSCASYLSHGAVCASCTD